MSGSANTYGCVVPDAGPAYCQPCLGEMTQEQCAATCHAGIQQKLGCNPTTGECRRGSGLSDNCMGCIKAPCGDVAVGFACQPQIGCALVYGDDIKFQTLDECLASGQCGKNVPTTYACDADAGCFPDIGGPFKSLQECRDAGCKQPDPPVSNGFNCDPDKGCVAVPAPGVGHYPTLEACQNQCKSIACKTNTGCATVPFGKGRYGSVAECRSSCVAELANEVTQARAMAIAGLVIGGVALLVGIIGAVMSSNTVVVRQAGAARAGLSAKQHRAPAPFGPFASSGRRFG